MSNEQTMTRTGVGFRSDAGRGRSTASSPDTTVIHDLGNLIQIALSALNIVTRSRGTDTANLEPIITGARTSLERASALVRQTIRTARSGVGALEEANVVACLDEVEALVQVTWNSKFRLDVRADPGLPNVRCDPLALQNAVLNLLFNARDAMPDGGMISIRAEEIPLDSGRGMELRIVDCGIGMMPNTIDRAFDLFFTTKCDGLGGVGLPMVQRFAHEAGGRVIIESEFGVGTTIRLQLPVPPQATDSYPALGSTLKRPYATSPIRSNARVPPQEPGT